MLLLQIVDSSSQEPMSSEIRYTAQKSAKWADELSIQDETLNTEIALFYQVRWS